MIYEIDKDIYRIVVPLEGSPLGTLNAYFFRGPEEEFLMDTGFNTRRCESSLRESLEKLAYRPERLNIINTHLHMDHTGLNHCFVGENRHIYISSEDLNRMLSFYKRDGYKRGARDRRARGRGNAGRRPLPPADGSGAGSYAGKRNVLYSGQKDHVHRRPRSV